MSKFLLKTLQIYKVLQDQAVEPLFKAPLIFDADHHPEQKPYVEVWRMQNEKGEGPYTGDVSVEDWRGPELHVTETGRPGPSFDEGFTADDKEALHPKGGYGRGQYPFAFETQDHLNKWFKPEEQQKLAALGFKPAKVKAKKVWSSGTQAFYEPYEEAAEQKLAASELDKSNYGPKNMGLYNPVDNTKRKSNRTGEIIAAAGPNTAVKQTSVSAKQQADLEAKYYKQKSKSQPVKIYTPEEIAKLKTHLESRTNKLKASEDDINKSGYSITHTPAWHGTTVTAHQNGQKVGEVHVDKQGLATTNIHPRHTNALAPQMHDYAQKVTGQRIKPAGAVGPKESKYWQSRMLQPMAKSMQIPMSWQHHYLQHQAPPKIAQPSTETDPIEMLKQRLVASGHLTYHPKKGLIRGRRIRNLGDNKPLMRSEEGPIKLVHYGRVSGLTQLEPGMQGTGYPDAAMKRRGKPEHPVTYYYRHGTQEEPEVASSAKSKYHVTLDPQLHKLYDFAHDKDRLVSQALAENGGAWNKDAIEGKVKNAGYHGYFHSGGALPGAVAIFHPMKVEREDLV